MASYADQARLATDPEFAAKVRVAIVRLSVFIQNEGIGASNHAARASLGYAVLSASGGQYVNNFAWALATGANSLADGYVTGGRSASALVDSDIEFVAGAVWDALASPILA